jgi:hypothetical protein
MSANVGVRWASCCVVYVFDCRSQAVCRCVPRLRFGLVCYWAGFGVVLPSRTQRGGIGSFPFQLVSWPAAR